MKRFDALITTQKNPGNPGKTKNGVFEKWAFLVVFLDFFQNGTLKRAEIFCVVISASKRFI